jgi:uncharacterized protein YdhG (YjbR/CyaY superfamily)
MNPVQKGPATIDEYIANYPAEVQAHLERIRATIRTVAPEATEAISYQIPTFKLAGRNLVHFAAFRDHLSFFPAASGVEHFQAELTGYKTARGTIQFPLDKPIPYELIEKITRFRVAENQAKAKKK